MTRTDPRRRLGVLVAVGACWLGSAVPGRAQPEPTPPDQSVTEPEAAQPDPLEVMGNNDYEAALQRYVEAGRAQGFGGLTASIGWMSDLTLDVRARNVNDIVTIQVIENIAGSGSADSALAKNSSGSASLGNFFGLETKLPSLIDPTNLVNATSDSDFTGSGSTARAGALTTLMGARVAEVLPNGLLVLEGIRELDINGDRQMVVLTGVVRPTDIGPNNVVLSPAIGQLRIRYFGEGLIKDNLQPGFIIRILNKIF